MTYTYPAQGRLVTPPRGSELAGLTVLHLDKDSEIIASTTGQLLEPLNIS